MILSALVVCFVMAVLLLVLSCKQKLGGRRRIFLMAGIVLAVVGAVPLALLVALAVSFGFIPGPPSMATLAQRFPARQAALERILAMSNEEPRLIRVDPAFLYTNAQTSQGSGPTSYGESGKDLPRARWDVYRKLFRQAGLHQGFSRDANGDVFFLANSEGLLDSGYSTGYLFCANQGESSAERSAYRACREERESGSYTAMDGQSESYMYQRVANHWFVLKLGAI